MSKIRIFNFFFGGRLSIYNTLMRKRSKMMNYDIYVISLAHTVLVVQDFKKCPKLVNFRRKILPRWQLRNYPNPFQLFDIDATFHPLCIVIAIFFVRKIFYIF